METKFFVCVNYGNDRFTVATDRYSVGWMIYRNMVKEYPPDAVVDLVDASTGEVIQHNPEWED